METESIDQIVMELVRCLGVEPAGPRDEHGRWDLYQQALARADCRRLLLDAIGWEPDPSLALAIVLSSLDQVKAEDREVWVSRLRTDKERAYAAKRSEETSILEDLTRSTTTVVRAEVNLADVSDWLQLRLAESCPHPAILEWLATDGRTKRIRNLAAHTLRANSGSVS